MNNDNFCMRALFSQGLGVKVPRVRWKPIPMETFHDFVFTASSEDIDVTTFGR